MHLTRVNLSSIRKFFAYLQDGVPGKLRAIHVLNAVYFIDKILSMIKPFMNAEVSRCVSIWIFFRLQVSIINFEFKM